MLRNLKLLLINFSFAVASNEFVMLTKDEPLQANIFNDIPVKDSLNTCIPDDGTLEVIFPWTINLAFYSLYDGANITDGIQIEWTNKNQIGDYAIIESQSGCFTVYNSGDTHELNIILFRWKEAQIENCNIDSLFVMSTPGVVSFTVTASTFGPCKSVVLAPPGELSGMRLSFWGTFPNESCTFQSPLSKRTWIPAYKISDAFIYSPALVIEIPASTTIQFSVSKIFSAWQDLVLDTPIVEMSPSYNGMKQTNYSQPFIRFNSFEDVYIVNFYLKIISGEERLVIYSDVDDANYTFTSADTGKNVSFTAASMIIYNFEVNLLTDYFLIEFTFSKNESATSLLTTTMLCTKESATDSKPNATIAMQLTTTNEWVTSESASTFSSKIVPTPTYSGSTKMSMTNAMIFLYFLFLFLIYQ